MGNGTPPPTNVRSVDFKLAIADLKKLRDDFQNEVIKKFDARMNDYSWDYLNNPDSENIQRGATQDWTNPFGRFREADRLLVAFDTSYKSANLDLVAVVNHLNAVITALQKTHDQYVLMENGNRQALSKQEVVDIFAASGLPSTDPEQK